MSAFVRKNSVPPFVLLIKHIVYFIKKKLMRSESAGSLFPTKVLKKMPGETKLQISGAKRRPCSCHISRQRRCVLKISSLPRLLHNFLCQTFAPFRMGNFVQIDPEARITRDLWGRSQQFEMNIFPALLANGKLLSREERYLMTHSMFRMENSVYTCFDDRFTSSKVRIWRHV